MSLIDQALKYYGVREISGPMSHPLISKMMAWAGVHWTDDDSKVAWCSIFLNYVADMAGYEKSGSMAAKSWLNVGREVTIENAKPGDVVILHRGDPNDWRGHVALFINQPRENKSSIFLLGGNQNNEVNISPYARTRIAGIRRLRKLQELQVV